MLRSLSSTSGFLFLAALASAAAQAPSLCDAGPAQLEHSAPWLGGSLELALDGAPPGAVVRLFHSPAAAQVPTPFGLLELERSQMLLVAGGTADVQGHWSTALSIPPDVSLAEVEGHYQALVQALDGTAALSGAVHLRYLGPRSYTLCAGDVLAPGAHPSLDVHALVDGTRVESMALNPWPPATFAHQDLWRPVFSADLARGACLSACGELVVFDNFELAIEAALAVESAFPRLMPSADGRLAYVLEQPSGAPPRIRALDLASAAFIAQIDLPATCAPYWSLDEASQHVFVQDADPSTGEPLARRVDLAGWQVLDTLQLGVGPDADLRWLETGDGWLYAGAKKGGPLSLNTFSALDLDAPGASAVTVDLGVELPKPPVTIPSVERLFVGASNTIGPAPDSVHVAPLDNPARLVEDPNTPNPQFAFGASVVRDDGFWMLTAPIDSDHAARLWHVHALSLSWIAGTDSWQFPWPATLLAARGTFADVLLMPRTGSNSPFATFEPALIVLDPLSGAITDSWTLAWGAVAGFVLEPD